MLILVLTACGSNERSPGCDTHNPSPLTHIRASDGHS